VATTAGPGLDLAANALLQLVRGFLPAPASGRLPKPQAALQTIAERSVGLGHRTGSVRLGGTTTELKGIRLDALVRFELWHTSRAGAEQEAADLALRLLAARDSLRAAGVLQLSLETDAPAVRTIGLGWFVAPAYRALFETEYLDTDGAQSLIARIPILLGREAAGAPGAESTTVTDALVRWDAAGADALVVRGQARVATLATLHYWSSAAPTGAFRLIRTTDPPPAGPPAIFTDLFAFLDAVAGAPGGALRHAQLELASIGQFLDALTADPVRVALGDIEPDGIPDAYQARSTAVDPPIELTDGRDILSFSYDHPAGLGVLGVLYLRVLSSSSP
jgi:hypothetical protein